MTLNATWMYVFVVHILMKIIIYLFQLHWKWHVTFDLKLNLPLLLIKAQGGGVISWVFSGVLPLVSDIQTNPPNSKCTVNLFLRYFFISIHFISFHERFSYSLLQKCHVTCLPLEQPCLINNFQSSLQQLSKSTPQSHPQNCNRWKIQFKFQCTSFQCMSFINH